MLSVKHILKFQAFKKNHVALKRNSHQISKFRIELSYFAQISSLSHKYFKRRVKYHLPSYYKSYYRTQRLIQQTCKFPAVLYFLLERSSNVRTNQKPHPPQQYIFRPHGTLSRKWAKGSDVNGARYRFPWTSISIMSSRHFPTRQNICKHT